MNNRIYCPNKNYYFYISIDSSIENCDAEVSPEYILDFDTNKPKQGKIGYIRFKNIDCLKQGVISHESVHCSTTYMRLFDPKSLVLNDEINNSEEKLAWLIGYFAKEIVNWLYNK